MLVMPDGKGYTEWANKCFAKKGEKQGMRRKKEPMKSGQLCRKEKRI